MKFFIDFAWNKHGKIKIKENASNLKKTYEKQPITRNNSIKQAKGRFIAFLDSDDRWKPNKLEVQIPFMSENGYELSYSSYMTCNRNGEIIGRITCKEKLRYRTLLRDNGIGCLTCIYDTKRIGKKFMPIVRKRQARKSGMQS